MSSANMKSQTKGKLFRVLMVTGVYPTEELPHKGTFIKSQIDSLVAAGVEVEIIHPKIGLIPLRYALTIMQVFLKTLTGRFDIVHGHYGQWCLFARMQWTTPVVASFLGDDLLGKPIANGGYSKIHALNVHINRWLCDRVDAVIVKSEQMKKVAAKDTIVVIPNGVDFDLFRPIRRAEARAELGWDQDRYYVLFGNDPQLPRKNYTLARAAIERLYAKGVSAELIVANRLPQKKVVLYINASNALILSSIHEGSPNIVKKTMASNVPIVSTDLGDLSQIIGPTKCF